MLTHVAGATKPLNNDGHGFLVSDNQLPRRLEPGDYHMSLCREFNFDGELTRLYAIDSLGRNFDASKADLEAVKKTVRELVAKGITKSSVRRA